MQATEHVRNGADEQERKAENLKAKCKRNNSPRKKIRVLDYRKWGKKWRTGTTHTEDPKTQQKYSLGRH
jgi:hypothetical protein